MEVNTVLDNVRDPYVCPIFSAGLRWDKAWE